MKVLNHNDFAAFDYKNLGNIGLLGDIVINEHNEIGVIIQTYSDGDIRTDMFGNCCMSEIRPATMIEIETFQPDILPHLTQSIPLYNLKIKPKSNLKAYNLTKGKIYVTDIKASDYSRKNKKLLVNIINDLNEKININMFSKNFEITY